MPSLGYLHFLSQNCILNFCLNNVRCCEHNIMDRDQNSFSNAPPPHTLCICISLNRCFALNKSKKNSLNGLWSRALNSEWFVGFFLKIIQLLLDCLFCPTYFSVLLPLPLPHILLIASFILMPFPVCAFHSFTSGFCILNQSLSCYFPPHYLDISLLLHFMVSF